MLHASVAAVSAQGWGSTHCVCGPHGTPGLSSPTLRLLSCQTEVIIPPCGLCYGCKVSVTEVNSVFQTELQLHPHPVQLLSPKFLR